VITSSPSRPQISVVAGAAVDAVGDAGADDLVVAVGAVEVEALGQQFAPR
jgi:hypothetical protein